MEFQIIRMTTESRENHPAVDTAKPRFGWWIEAGENGLLQKAYRIVVKCEEQVFWDSGKVLSEKMFQVEYEGKELLPEKTYTWEVTIWDQDGQTQTNSSSFDTAFLSEKIEAWEGAKWIGSNHLPLNTFALSVFKMSCRLQLNAKAQKAGFMFGGDDPRLLDATKNLYGVENKPGESYCLLTLDVSSFDKTEKVSEDVAADENGKACLSLYRVGYAAGDSADTPLLSTSVPQHVINEENRFEPHTIFMECEYGQLELYIDQVDEEHRILPKPNENPILNMERRWNVNPMGRGGDYTCYPLVAKIGAWDPSDQAVFEYIRIANYREPSNLLYSGVPAVNELVDVSHGANAMLAAKVQADKQVKRARIYATARGVYELYLNGAKVGEDFLAPGLSQYDQHQFYQCYDVTDSIQMGVNGIGAVLAEGWFSGSISYTGSNWNYFGDRSSLLLKLVLEFEDGTKEVLVSNDSDWYLCEDGPIRYASIFQGEIRDMRLEKLLTDFTRPEFPLDTWAKAELIAEDESVSCLHTPVVTMIGTIQPGLDYTRTRLLAQPDAGVKVAETLTAVSVTEPFEGVYIYDMGQNMAGVEEIEIDGREGQKIVMRFAEILYPDLPEYASVKGTMMLENIRGALATDEFILREGHQILRPSFTYHGYRYIEISGLTQPLPLTAVRGLSISSLTELAADFECSDPIISRLYQNIGWSLRDNYISIPSDCPQRNERMGWSGDISVFGRTAVQMSLCEPFLHRHMKALQDTQVDGRFADIAPIGGGFGGTLWGSVGLTLPWEMYLQYGDKRVLEEMYPNMKEYIRFLMSKRDDNGIVQEGPLGDWLGPENSSNESAYLWQCYFVYDLEILSKTAELLGYEEDAKEYQKEYCKAKEDFLRVYRDEETGLSVFSSKTAAMNMNSPFTMDLKEKEPSKTESGKYIIDTQTSYAVPLALGLYKEDQEALAAERLNQTCCRENIDDLKEARKPYTLMTGFIGTSWISQTLSEYGYDETAWRMLKETSYPSWLYPVLNGATTIWERLNSYTKENGFGGNNSMNSFNHYSFGAVGNWMLAYAGGVRRTETPGVFKIAPIPDPDGDVTWASVDVKTVSGHYKVRWERNEECMTYKITIPGGRPAEVELPMDETQAFRFMEHMEEADEILYKDGKVSFTLLPGSYTF